MEVGTEDNWRRWDGLMDGCGDRVSARDNKSFLNKNVIITKRFRSHKKTVNLIKRAMTF